MTQLQQSLATLRIWGDDLVPDEITALLGRGPTLACSKGDPIAAIPKGDAGTAKTGAWHLQAADSVPADIDSQIRELLGGMSSDLAMWRKLRERYHVDLFCGLFLGHGNEGVAINAPNLVALGVRGIQLGLDIYAPKSGD